MNKGICAGALLYTNKDIQKVRACLIFTKDGDTEDTLLTRAKDYFNTHPTISKEIEGLKLTAWQFSVSEDVL